jgi:site-specific DNA-methyltransferase (adenine-specific)
MVMPELNRIYQGDCLEIMKGWPDGFIDLVVTSPPYDNLRDYKGFSFDAGKILSEVFRVLKSGGVCVWVVGDQVINGSESLTSFRHALAAVECGLRLHDTMIYMKDGVVFPDKTRYAQLFEYMFVFSKGSPKTFNPILKHNIHAGKKVSGTDREPDGSLSKRMGKVYPDMSPLPNVWQYSTGWMKNSKDPIAFEHPATFPEKLAGDHIISWSNEGDVVLDVFSGSGTTAIMAERLSRKWLGCEIEQTYVRLAQERIAAEQAQGKLF